MGKSMRGVFAIPCTPFNENLELDETSLKSCIDFIVDAGAHGIVVPVNASEFHVLTEEERMRVVDITAAANRRRLPLVAGVTGVYSKTAVMLAKHAQQAGADALIAMPPCLIKATEEEIFAYYKAISDAVDLPIFIQNYIPPVGTAMSAAFMIKMVKEIPNVVYIKEETAYSGHVISEVMELASSLPPDTFGGVMGGKAGRYILDEYRRGSTGNMPACEICDIQAKIWAALEQGREEDAIAMFNRVLPLLNMEAMFGSTMYKMVLHRRGVIRCPKVRSLGNRHLDQLDEMELDRLLEEAKPLFAL